MNRSALILSGVWIAIGSPAACAVSFIDLPVSGLASVGEYGEPSNSVRVYDVASALGFAPGTQLTVTGIGWNVRLTALTPSWLDDMSARIGSVPPGFRDVMITPALNATYPGEAEYFSPIISLQQSGLPLLGLIGGLCRVEVFEFVDDLPGSQAEGIWKSGSIRLRIFETPPPPPPAPVPHPGAMTSAGLALLAAARRRR